MNSFCFVAVFCSDVPEDHEVLSSWVLSYAHSYFFSEYIYNFLCLCACFHWFSIQKWFKREKKKRVREAKSNLMVLHCSYWSRNNKIYVWCGELTRTFTCELLKRLIQFPTSRLVFVLTELHLPPTEFGCGNLRRPAAVSLCHKSAILKMAFFCKITSFF